VIEAGRVVKLAFLHKAVYDRAVELPLRRLIAHERYSERE